MAALTAQMVQEQVAWATLIQTCAPGSKVLLVGSHADEVEGGEAEVERRCRDMAERVHAELAKYREAQQTELDSGLTNTVRKAQLRKVLSNPLRLSAEAIAVSSAKSPDGSRHPGLEPATNQEGKVDDHENHARSVRSGWAFRRQPPGGGQQGQQGRPGRCVQASRCEWRRQAQG